MSNLPAGQVAEHRHVVTIEVNGHPVKIEGPRVTGAQIKVAAIAQGVPIQSDFQLSEELGDHRTRVVGDNDVVAVHEGSRFVAVAPDDNS